MFREVSKKWPCEICGKDSWCSRSDDGRVVICRRISEGGIRKIDKNGNDFYIHKIGKWGKE